MDETRDFIICQIQESLETNELLDLTSLTDRILLYNSIIALIVLPVEEMRRSGTKDEKNPLYVKSLSDLREACDFSLEIFEPIAGYDKKKKVLQFNKRDIHSFMRKLRNAIAHQNVRFSEQDNIAHITFSNIYTSTAEPSKEIVDQLESRKLKPNKKSVEDFRITLTFEGLRDLSSWIGSEYLRALQFNPSGQA